MRKIKTALDVDFGRKEGEANAKVAVREAEKKAEDATKVAEDATKKVEDAIKKALKRGKLSLEEIAEDFDVTVEYVQKIENKMKNS